MGQYYKIQITRKLNKPKEEKKEWAAIHEILFGAREDEKEPRYALEIFDKSKGLFKTIVSESYGKRWEGDHIDSAEFIALEQMLYNKRAVVNIVWDYSKWASITRWDTFEEKNFYEIGDKIRDEVKRPRYLINYTHKIYVDMDEYRELAEEETKNSIYKDDADIFHPIALLLNVWDTVNDERYIGMNRHNIGSRCDTVIWMSDTLPEGCKNDTKNSVFVENGKRWYEITKTRNTYYIAIDEQGEIIKRFQNYWEIYEREMNYFKEQEEK